MVCSYFREKFRKKLRFRGNFSQKQDLDENFLRSKKIFQIFNQYGLKSLRLVFPYHF
jgi:hypothetical protein